MPGIMHLLRCLVFIEARQGCFLHLVYIDTKANLLADALSRNNLPLFLSKVPYANLQPTGSASGSTVGLDLSALEPSIQLYFQNGLAPSTQKTYKAAMKRFHSF